MAAAEAATLMRKLDVNSDGVISLDEFQAYFEAQATKTAKVAARMVKLGKSPPEVKINMCMATTDYSTKRSRPTALKGLSRQART